MLVTKSPSIGTSPEQWRVLRPALHDEWMGIGRDGQI